MKSYLLYLIAGVLAMVALATLDSPLNMTMNLFAPTLVDPTSSGTDGSLLTPSPDTTYEVL